MLHSLVVHTGRESIKLAPPLTITRSPAEGVRVLEETIADYTEDETK